MLRHYHAFALVLTTWLAACAEEREPPPTWLAVARTVGEQKQAVIEFTPWPQRVQQVRLGVTPFTDKEAMHREFASLLDFLSGRLGVPVSLVIAENYSDLGTRMREQSVDLAKFSPLSYVEAKMADPGLRLLLRQVREGSTTYLGYVYTRAEDPARTIHDLEGRSFCFVDPHSTSGYLYPRALMFEQGIDPDAFFGSIVFGGHHSACIEKVLAGEVDAGATYSGKIFSSRRKGIPVHRLKILGKTSRIPCDAYCVRSDLPRAAAERIKQELMALSTRSPGGRVILGSAARRLNAWTEAQDSDYDSIRRALKYAARASREAGRHD